MQHNKMTTKQSVSAYGRLRHWMSTMILLSGLHSADCLETTVLFEEFEVRQRLLRRASLRCPGDVGNAVHWDLRNICPAGCLVHQKRGCVHRQIERRAMQRTNVSAHITLFHRLVYVDTYSDVSLEVCKIRLQPTDPVRVRVSR